MPPAEDESSSGDSSDGELQPATEESADYICSDGTPDCVPVDLLVVVDNSRTMGDEQHRIAQALPHIVERLQTITAPDGRELTADVQIVVTSSDVGNPLCLDSHSPEGYEAARGAPQAVGCNSRLEHFVTYGDAPVSYEDACTEACPVDVEPSGPILTFRGSDSNVPNDDVAQALACIGPQGVVGCGYESPLEAMIHSIHPDSPWNFNDGFVRDGGVLAIAIFTDESDCSIRDWTMLDNEEFMAVDPATGTPEPTSAMCWNAGVSCDGPDENGEYTNCQPASGPLHPVSRYVGQLDYVRRNNNKKVVMLGVAGVPIGGGDDLVVREWKEGAYPQGDVPITDWEAGVTADDLAFNYGVGPGCSATDGDRDLLGHATPPVRLREVCHGADGCCLTSICESDFKPAIDCLGGLIEDAL